MNRRVVTRMFGQADAQTYEPSDDRDALLTVATFTHAHFQDAENGWVGDWHLTGKDRGGKRYWLCLQGWGQYTPIEELAHEFEAKAVPGHIPNVVCTECFDWTLEICRQCHGDIAGIKADACPHCGRSFYD